jgi:hypothetical protein
MAHFTKGSMNLSTIFPDLSQMSHWLSNFRFHLSSCWIGDAYTVIGHFVQEIIFGIFHTGQDQWSKNWNWSDEADLNCGAKLL